MHISQALEQLGFSKRESSVYIFLLKNGPSRVSAIAEGTDIARPNIYEISRLLSHKGLIRTDLQGHSRLIVAEPPKKIEELAKQKVSLAQQLVPFLTEIDATPGFRSTIHFYEGRKAMQNLFVDALSCKKREILYLWSPKDMDKILGKKVIENFITKRLKLSVSIRSLRPSEKESLYTNESSTSTGIRLTQVAYLPENFTFSLSVALYDDKAAFFSSQKESFGFVVESKEFSQMMRMLYEGMWLTSGKIKITT